MKIIVVSFNGTAEMEISDDDHLRLSHTEAPDVWRELADDIQTHAKNLKSKIIKATHWCNKP